MFLNLCLGEGVIGLWKHRRKMMRVYVSLAQVVVIAHSLREKDMAYHVVSDARLFGELATQRKSWGCILCPLYGPNDAELLLKAWNRTGHGLVQAAIIKLGTVDCLVACPESKQGHSFVTMILKKLLAKIQ